MMLSCELWLAYFKLYRDGVVLDIILSYFRSVK